MSSAIETRTESESGGGKTPLIELRHVGKSYGAIIALKDISLRVNAGEVTCVLGDNGAGKSTLIKIMAGLHQQSEGELLVDGEETLLESPKDALAFSSSRLLRERGRRCFATGRTTLLGLRPSAAAADAPTSGRSAGSSADKMTS